MKQHRLLAAIMFTDIEGYTSVMQYNETEAVMLRKLHRDIFETALKKYNGKIIQYFGDGTLSIFKSSVDAVECAIEMQLAFLKQAKIPVRIGIHVGDIIYSKEDIIGDAVNIASRIESGAVAGSILISDKVHDQIRNQRQIQTRFLDAYEIKNVDDTMPIFAIANEGLVIPEAHEIKGKLKAANHVAKVKKNYTKPLFALVVLLLLIASIVGYYYMEKEMVPDDYSIAVLPFDNLSLEENSDIFRDGITEDILTNLSKLKDLRVISRKSVERYKETKKTIPEIALELGVTYILEGSIRKFGDRIRVTAQLIHAKTDENIWAEDYDKTLTNIFDIQSEVSQEIVGALRLNLSFEELQGLKAIPTTNIEAYQLFLRGRQEADKRNKESIEESITLYKQAIALDSTYAEAYAEIANSIFLETYYAGADPVEATKLAELYLDKAEQLNDKIARIYTVKGLLYNHQKQFDKAKEAFEKSIKLSPNDVTARHQYATFFYYTKQYELQLEQSKIAYSLDPLSFATASNYFSALTYNEKFDEAEKLLENIIANNTESDPFVINRLYMRLYMGIPDFRKAIKPLTYLAEKDPAYYRILGYSYAKMGDRKQALNTLDSIKKLEKGPLKNHRLAVVFAGLDQADSVFYYLDTTRNKSSRFNSDRLYYFDDYKSDPRYQDLLLSHGILPE